MAIIGFYSSGQKRAGANVTITEKCHKIVKRNHVVVSRSNFQIHFLGFCNGRFPHIRFPVHTGLLSSEKIDELSGLIPNVDRDLTVIGIEISPGIFLDVCTIDINGSRIGGQILASICVTIRIIQLEDQNVSGLGTSNLKNSNYIKYILIKNTWISNTSQNWSKICSLNKFFFK